MKTIVKSLMLLLFASSMVFAQKNWILDKAHSSIRFEAEHIVVSEDIDPEQGYPTVGVTEGEFKEFDVQFLPKDESLENSIFVATIDAGSIDTGNLIRDMDLRSENFFWVEKYPTITFRSKSLKKISDNKYKMVGDLTIRGITKEVELEVWITSVSNSLSKYLSFTANGLIDRFEFGMKWSDIFENGRFRVSQYIRLKIQANFVGLAKS
jgi:polyisoprenoid-binding protein YceI